MRYTSFSRQAELVQTRFTSIKGVVDAAHNKSTPPNEINKQRLISYGQEVQEKYLSFQKLLKQLVSLESMPEDYNSEEVTKYEEEISDLKIKIESSIKVLVPPCLETDIKQSASFQVPVATVKLPHIQLPTFDGSEPHTWLTFFNIFNQTIHMNETLSAVDKHQYLLSCLSGEARGLIKGLPITTANYKIAFGLLKERYHNKRRLVTYHATQILDMPNLSHVSMKGLHSFIHCYLENVQALQALDYNLEQEYIFLILILIRKLDSQTRKRFEDSRQDSCELPTVKELLCFLQNELKHLEGAQLGVSSASSSTVTASNNRKPNETYSQSKTSYLKAQPNKPFKTALLSTSRSPCAYCNQDHVIYKCSDFGRLPPKERFSCVKRQKWCINCLGREHSARDCPSKQTCKVCESRHHTLLHFVGSEPKPSASDKIEQSEDPSPSSPSVFHSTDPNDTFAVLSNQNDKTVLLATTLAQLSTPNGKSCVVRGLIDCAAQTSFITEHCAQLLGVSRERYSGHIGGISLSKTKPRGLAHLNVSSLSGNIIAYTQPFLILEKITSYLPQQQVSQNLKEQLKSFVLADPTFCVPAPIDFLLGADLFPSIFTGNRFSLGPNMPVVYSTVFGSVVMGPASTAGVSANSPVTLLTVNDTVDLHDCLQRFWQLEEPPAAPKMSSLEDQFCENHFVETVSRDETGRYVVRLPMKPNAPQLGDSLPLAQRRFYTLELKLKAQPAMGKLYANFMKEYLETGHMKICKILPSLNSQRYFLPHHGVIKESSSTTKLRVVFDASARTSTGISLNDVLLPGPKLQSNIIDIICLFRLHNYVLVCDIRMMFRQMLVHPEDQLLQLVLWRETPSHPLTTYQLQTVTYGLNCSPFLAIRTLQQLVADEGRDFPMASEVLKTQVYMDDILTGSDTIDQANNLKTELCELLKRGGFELRKWASNSSKLLKDVPESHQEKPLPFKAPDQPLFNILGLYWNQKDDRFCYNVIIKPTAVTKRQALSTLARLYDPCGWLTPVTFMAKVFIQRLWTAGLNWDEMLPPDLASHWKIFLKELPDLEKVSLERNLSTSQATDIQIHGFGDASEQGYAAAVYLRCVTPEMKVKVNLLIAKAKVAPLKRVSLPRLELCGAHLLAKLMSYCINLYSSHLHINSFHAWSDSTIVLAWISTPPYRLKTYVGNRVAEIQELTPTDIWHHVDSKHNPADCASRGIPPSQLKQHPLWWTGPPWLQSPSSNWPTENKIKMSENEIPEIKPVQHSVLVSIKQESLDFLTRFSSFSKLCRIMAYVLRFINALKHEPTSGPLSLQEIKDSTLQVCKLVQQDCFSGEIAQLKRNLPCSQRLQRLNPFLDKDNVIKVGGRLNHSQLPDEIRHPVVLPKSHHVTTILIDHFHVKHLHAGPQLLQSLISQQYWILSARSIIRSRIFKCVSCFRTRPTTKIPLMGDLPEARVRINKPFYSSGMDYSGPHTIKVYNLRRMQKVKVYLCIFVCFATKATHIEVVTDLTSDSFLAALNRFISRRGNCSHLYSDCGTAFVGAASQLKRTIKTFMEENISPFNEFCVNHNITFHFNPPAAPHQGGLWEAAVKSVKYHLSRVIGDHTLTLEEFITLSTQIEAMLNSRPLTVLSADPSEPTALTPGHFLTSAPLVAVPETPLEDVSFNKLRRWQVVQSFNQRIWRRWQLEYLQSLQQRMKWNKKTPNIKVGDIVLLHDPKCAPLSWPLGRVIDIFPGTDGIVRVVKVKTTSGTYIRPVVKIFPLPQD